MAIEYKYGRVTTEHGNIPDDEPVVVFRAKDKMLPKVLQAYYSACQFHGSPDEHLDRINDTRRKIMDWQNEHPTLTKVPD